MYLMVLLQKMVTYNLQKIACLPFLSNVRAELCNQAHQRKHISLPGGTMTLHKMSHMPVHQNNIWCCSLSKGLADLFVCSAPDAPLQMPRDPQPVPDCIFPPASAWRLSHPPASTSWSGLGQTSPLLMALLACCYCLACC